MASKSVTKLLKALPAFRSLSCIFEPGAESVGEVADRLGRLAAVRAEIERYERALKDLIIERGDAAVEGRHYRATLSTYEANRLDTTAIKEAMPEKWLAKYTVTSTVTKVQVRARIGLGLGEEAA